MNENLKSPRQRVDAHHHLWQLDRFPYEWLAPRSAPRPFGDHGALKRDYLLADYLTDIAGTGITGSVFVEANAGAHAAREIEWVEEIAAQSRLPSVAVGHVDLRRADVALVLSEFQRSSRMRGVRMSLCWDERPQWRFIERPDVMLTDEFRAGLAILTRQDLVFDALVMPGQLSQLAQLASGNPDQSIVIDHLGTPWFDTIRDQEAWQTGMRECARCMNVAVKISGLWTLDRKWRPEFIHGPVRFVLEAFGTDRCLWGSNLPVEKIMCPINEQIGNLDEVLADLSENEKNQVFRDTAMRVYRIDRDAGQAIG